ncbi:MAG: SIS domain-containing protein [Candidatus Omnitrophica bacterium]|nr:SIS domain-containing protein [Candidatus Omnitrophota bacterium]
MKKQIKAILKESIEVKRKLGDDKIITAIEKLVNLALAALKNGGKLILFGNGGSAADAQHIAAELVGRFTQERKALAALALNCNSSNLTSIANDYEFKQIFSRQIEALGKAPDLAIGISTSGKSPNILTAIAQAKKMGMKTAMLTGLSCPELEDSVDVCISIPSKNTARIQEAHITVGHIICELIEKAFLTN